MHVAYYDLKAFQRKHGKLLLLLLGIAFLCFVDQQGERQDRKAQILLTSGSHDYESESHDLRRFSSQENRIHTQVLAPDAEPKYHIIRTPIATLFTYDFTLL